MKTSLLLLSGLLITALSFSADYEVIPEILLEDSYSGEAYQDYLVVTDDYFYYRNRESNFYYYDPKSLTSSTIFQDK